MKNLWLSLSFFLFSAAALLANGHIPEVVQKTFTQLYPEIENPFWENRHDGIVATFKDKEVLKKAFFKPDGQWIETRIRMGLGLLPTGVENFVRENYQNADISFCGKVYAPGGVWYRVESELPGKVVLKTLDESGKLIEEQILLYSTAIASDIATTPAVSPLPNRQIAPLRTE